VLALACCQQPPASSLPAPRYTVGQPYQAAGVWRYPHEQFSYTDTGLAVVATRGPGPTADGEAYDPGALAAAQRTLQLPALARVTNLETGRSVLVRVNDRGPEAPGRLIALTPRAAELLGAGSAPFRVRVQLMEAESRQMAAGMSEAPPLTVATAPRASVQAETLAPPAGTAASRGRTAPAGPVAVMAVLPSVAAVPLRLPEQVWQSTPTPGALYVECGSFSQLEYAAVMQGQLTALGARVSTDYYAPRDAAFRVRLGPFNDVTAADAALDRALKGGVSDARIVVDSF
jgi:rare lipoprotein A